MAKTFEYDLFKNNLSKIKEKQTNEIKKEDKEIDDIKDNIIINSNFKENLERYLKSINSLRTENPIDLF
ncbi:MAG: hypothetical protein B6I28_06420 [Fusobacteriia bacterium 4572_132]|nr:MAG: hypothetical protein B6I28_06420 [Fusobacteriia bacterium 4572_132]